MANITNATIFIVLIINSLVSNAAVVKRETSTPSSADCPIGSPCGWAVYVPFSRTVEYFMKNTCFCSSGQVCVRTDDDLAINAFVYRCRFPKPTEPPSS